MALMHVMVFLIASWSEYDWLLGFPGVPSAPFQAWMADWSQHCILHQDRAQIAGGNGSWVVLEFCWQEWFLWPTGLLVGLD